MEWSVRRYLAAPEKGEGGEDTFQIDRRMIPRRSGLPILLQVQEAGPRSSSVPARERFQGVPELGNLQR